MGALDNFSQKNCIIQQGKYVCTQTMQIFECVMRCVWQSGGSKAGGRVCRSVGLQWYVNQVGVHSLHTAYGQCLMKT